MVKPLLFLEKNKVNIMPNTEENLKFALDNGLFEKSQSKDNDSNVFDLYGNYVFPTDFSTDNDNTILSLSTTNFTLKNKS